MLHDDLFTVGVDPAPVNPNIAKVVEFKLGDVEKGFAEADVIVERSFETAQSIRDISSPTRVSLPLMLMVRLSFG